MEYNDYYLKFAGEAEMLTVYQPPSEDSAGITYPGLFVDIIGLIVETPAVFGSDGNVTSEAVFAEGWHVNMRCTGELPDALKSFEIVAPSTPVRVWA